MFFSDPVAAFGNLRRAARPGATLRFAAWRGVAENSFMTVAETAAAPLLPELPARVPDAPGQFAFAARERMQVILRDSGWRDVDIQPVDVACVFPESELLQYLTWMGPVGRALQQADAQFSLTGGGYRAGADIGIFCARRGRSFHRRLLDGEMARAPRNL